METFAILVALPIFALVSSAVYYAAAYFTVGRLVSARVRAIVSAVIAAIVWIAFALLELSGLVTARGPAPTSALESMLAFAIFLAGLMLWTWRTHASDAREDQSRQ